MVWVCGPVDLGVWRLRYLKLTKYKSVLGVLIFDYLVTYSLETIMYYWICCFDFILLLLITLKSQSYPNRTPYGYGYGYGYGYMDMDMDNGTQLNHISHFFFNQGF